MSVAGMKVLVTGASSGIGAALARQLAQRGATVGIVARREDRLQEVLDDCRRHAGSGDSRMWVADLSDTDRAVEVVEQAWHTFGHLDVVVNNAAMSKRRHLDDMTFVEYEQVLRLNFLAPVRIALATLALMRDRGSGQVVMVASTGGRLGIVHESAYCAAKGALCQWAESAAIDLRERAEPIGVKLVNPGPIDTEIWNLVPGELPGAYAGPKVPADEAAAGIVDAIESEGFEFWVPAYMKEVAAGKAADVDGYVKAAAAAARDLFGSGDTTPP